MSLPLATTTITVLRSASTSSRSADPMAEGYEQEWTAATWLPVKRNVRAVISPATGKNVAASNVDLTDLVLKCDPTQIKSTDRILDESTQVTYDVVYSFDSANFAGLGHTEAGLRFNSGAAS